MRLPFVTPTRNDRYCRQGSGGVLKDQVANAPSAKGQAQQAKDKAQGTQSKQNTGPTTGATTLDSSSGTQPTGRTQN